MFEVFFTTIIICTVSALIILTTGLYGSGPDGAALSIASFNSIIPGIGGFIVTVSTVFFALSTILGWAYYGEVCATYLFKHHQKKAVLVYRIVYIVFVFVGAVARIDIVWIVADCFNALMALPNLVALVLLSKVVIDATREHFEKNKLHVKED
jgi:AGCS family alanine or glycine:cation symporter